MSFRAIASTYETGGNKGVHHRYRRSLAVPWFFLTAAPLFFFWGRQARNLPTSAWSQNWGFHVCTVRPPLPTSYNILLVEDEDSAASPTGWLRPSHAQGKARQYDGWGRAYRRQEM